MAKRKRGKSDDAHARKGAPPPHTNPKKAKLDRPAAPAPHQNSTIPFDPSDRILLLGEGDFSFATSLVEHHACHALTATCLDSRTEVLSKYAPQAEEHIQLLEEAGQTVLYNVDATKLERNKALAKAAAANASHGEHSEAEGFDKIIFNFPHIGGKSTDVNRQVRANQELLVSFFASCTSTSLPLLSTPHGQILITLFESAPYTLWNIRDLARHSGLEVERSFKFDAGLYPGYRHARTLGNLVGDGGWRGEERGARTYVFRRKGGAGVGTGQGKGGKRKRGGEEEDEDGFD